MDALTLLAVFAHPDDEAYGMGGSLAKYAAEGCDVHLATATRGEAGQIAAGVDASPATLPDVREHELRCACRSYGIHPPHLLGYMDGQLTIVHQGQAVGRLVRLLRRVRPQVVVTFGPDGIYGHYDHIAVHRWTTIAVELAADPSCFADSPAAEGQECRPHEVAKLYHHVLPEEQLAAMRDADGRAAVLMDGVPFAFVGYPPKEITTRIDVSATVQAKVRGLRCHATQVGNGTEASWAEAARDPFFRTEWFRLVRSTVGWPDGVETDLFAGLR